MLPAVLHIFCFHIFSPHPRGVLFLGEIYKNVVDLQELFVVFLILRKSVRRNKHDYL